MALHWKMDKLGTIGGADVPLYGSAGVFIFSGAVNSANVVHSAFTVSGGTLGTAYTWNRMTVYDSGTAIDNVFSSGGSAIVYSGGLIQDCYVSAGAVVFVSAGGIMAGGSVCYNDGSIYRGTLKVTSGGVISGVDTNGEIWLTSYGVASGCVTSNAFFICGGTATDTELVKAAIRVGHTSGTQSGGTAYNTITRPPSSAIVHVSKSAEAYNTMAYDGGQLIVSSGGYASGVDVGRTSSDITRLSYLYVSSGGIAEDIVLKDSTARMMVHTDAIASNIVISSGASGYASTSNSIVSSATVSAGGVLYAIAPGALLKDISIRGTVTLSSGAVIRDSLIYAGATCNLKATDTTASNVTLAEANAYLRISDSTAHAIDCTTSSYYMIISGGGTATNTYIAGTGQLQIHKGIAYNVNLPEGGVVSCHSSGAILSGGTFTSGTLQCVGSADSLVCGSKGRLGARAKTGSEWVGQITNAEINSGGIVYASGGTVTSTILNSGAAASALAGTDNKTGAFYDTTMNSYALMYVRSGGIASNTVAEQHAQILAYSGGTVLEAVLDDAAIFAYQDSYVSNVTKYATTTSRCVHISGGTCEDVRIMGGGAGIAGLMMFSGSLNSVYGDVYNSTVPYGKVSGGEIADVDWTSGYLYIYTGARMASADLKGNAVTRLYGGSAYDVRAFDKASFNIVSGSAYGIVLSGPSARMTISANTTSMGAYAEDVTVHSGGRIDMNNGNTSLTSCTVSTGGIVVAGSGLVSSVTLSGGLLYLRSGGCAYDTHIASGTMLVQATSSYASNTTVTGGMLTIESGGTIVENTVIGGGTITARCNNSGSMSGVTMLEKSLMYVSSTGVITDLGVSGGTINMQGGTITGLTGTDITLIESAAFPPSTINTFNIAGAACNMAPNKLTLTDGTFDSSAVLHLYSGVLDQTTVTNQAYAFVYTGSAAHNQVTLAGQVHYVNNTVASTAVVGGWGQIHISSGAVLQDGYAEADGFIVISGGGSADSPTIANGGNLYVMAGGIATNVTAEDGAIIQVLDGGSITYK